MHKQNKRRHGGKLRRLTQADKKTRKQHNDRTGRADKLFIKHKVIPNDNSDST